MSWVSDSAPLIADAWVSSAYVGHGITGAEMRATTGTGTHGPGYLYNDWDSGADDAKEFRGLLLTVPAAGTFTAWEDGSFTLSGAPDGVYTFDYRLFVDGADLGVATVTLTIGAAGASISHSATLAAVTSSMAAQVELQVSTSHVLDAVTGTMAVQIGLGVSMAAQLGAVQSTMLMGSGGASELMIETAIAPVVSYMQAQVELALSMTGQLGAVQSDFVVTNSAGEGPGSGATAAQIWGYILPNGRTAGATVADLLVLLTDLHKLNGLDPTAPLTVSRTARIAGDVEQALQTVGEIVTVTRQ